MSLPNRPLCCLPWRGLPALAALLCYGAIGPAQAATPRVAVGADFVVVSRSDGTVWAWGLGSDGQLGQGTRSSSSRPVPVSGLTGVVDVVAADGVAAALKADGTVWVWGSGANGIFGSTQTDSTIRAVTPVQVPELSGIWALALGRNGPSGFAADTQGRVFQWGNNYSGQAGDGTSSGNAAVRKVPALVPGLSNVAALAAADTSFVAAQWGAGLSGWGHNEAGALGTTERTQRGGLPLPVQPIPGLTDVVALASMDINDNVQFAVLRNGTVAGWGSNRGAQAGCGQVDVSTATLTAPRPVNGLQSIFAAAAGTAHALFVDLDGAVYGCGSNANGQLGDSTTAGTTSARPGPVRGSLAVPALAVAAGRNTSAAVGADGSVWVWGQVPNGAAGDGGPTTGTGSLQFLAPQPVVGAAGSGRFDAGPVAAAPALFTGTQTGALGRATVNVGLSPLPADVGAEGRVYLAAVLPDGSLYLYSDATGWQLYGGGTLPAYLSGPLSRHVAMLLFRDLDLTGIAGVKLALGYGLGSSDVAAQTDMLTRGLVAEVLTLR
jgi:alpha-tubulin suppressor-like RCC1 family protein